MPVSLGATPTEVNLNGTNPSIPSGKLAVNFQASAAYTDPNNGSPVRDVSAYVDSASSSGGTHAEPLTDGNGNFIFAAGDIVCVVGVPN